MRALVIISIILEFCGSITIAFTVLRVHQRFLDERKIDAQVLKELRREQKITLAGLSLIVTAFMLRIISFSQGQL